MSVFKHTTKIEVRFVDMDAFGHVNNAHYLTYIEQARVNYFNDVVGYHYDWNKEGLILAHADVDFISPIHFNDDISVKTRCSRVGNKSMEMEYEIVQIKGKEEILKAKGKTVTVSYDYTTNTSIPVPEKWRKKFEELEG